LNSDMAFEGMLVEYRNGQTLGGPYRRADETNADIGSVSFHFATPKTGTITSPDGAPIPIQRFTF